MKEQENNTESIAKRIIKNWLEEKFKNPEAMPELMINGLAKEFDEHKWEIYNMVQIEYLNQDIDFIVNNMGETITDNEREYIIHRYSKIEDTNMEELSCIVDDVIEDRKRLERTGEE